MIEKLTKAQEKKISAYLKVGEKIGYRTKTIDRAKAKKAINYFYTKVMKINKPKYVIFLDSPMACQLARNLIKNTKFDGKNLEKELGSQLRSQIGSQLDSQLDSQLRSQLYSQLRSQLRSQLGSQLYSQLDSQLGSQLRSQLYSQLGSQLYSQLGSQLRSQLVSQLDSQLGSQLYSQLGSQLYSQLGSQLYSQLVSQLGSQNLERLWESTSNWCWTGYYTMYYFILNELMPEKKKTFKMLGEVLQHSAEIHMSYMFPEIVFISDFPKVIHLNVEKQLHNYDEAALQYRDGYSIYRSNGVNMKPELIATPKDKITKEMFLSEENVDSRREISRKIGIDNTIKMLGAEVIDTYKSKVGGTYELLLIDFDNRGTKRPYLKMNNPSMKDVSHIEGVSPDCKTVKDAIMFRNGLIKFIEPKVLS